MKEHLAGGTLRKVMVAEVLRAIRAHQGRVEPAALELGITPRTLRLWKHTWVELSTVQGAMEKLLRAGPKSKTTGVKKKKPRKTPLRMKTSKN